MGTVFVAVPMQSAYLWFYPPGVDPAGLNLPGMTVWIESPLYFIMQTLSSLLHSPITLDSVARPVVTYLR
jgi:hypothetical protein